MLLNLRRPLYADIHTDIQFMPEVLFFFQQPDVREYAKKILLGKLMKGFRLYRNLRTKTTESIAAKNEIIALFRFTNLSISKLAVNKYFSTA